MQTGSRPVRFSREGVWICVQIPECRPRAGAGRPRAPELACARGTNPARQRVEVRELIAGAGGGGCERAAGWTLRSSSRDGTPVALGDLGPLGAAPVCRGAPHR